VNRVTVTAVRSMAGKLQGLGVDVVALKDREF